MLRNQLSETNTATSTFTTLKSMATKTKQTKPLPERLVAHFFVGCNETNKILYELALQSRMQIGKIYRQEIKWNSQDFLP